MPASDAVWQPYLALKELVDASDRARPQQLPFGFVDLSDRITTSVAARILEMSAENVRVLARNGVLDFETLPGVGTRLFSRKQCLQIKSQRDVEAAWQGQPLRRIRMSYAAYRSGGR